MGVAETQKKSAMPNHFFLLRASQKFDVEINQENLIGDKIQRELRKTAKISSKLKKQLSKNIKRWLNLS